MHRKSSI